MIEPVDAERSAASMWRRAAYCLALLLATALCYFLVHVPLQISDDVTNLIGAEANSVGEIIAGELSPGATYFRPMLTLAVNGAFEAGRAINSYFLAAKTIQIAQVVVLLLLVVRLLRVETARDFAAASVALLAVVGMHTFFFTVHELYPVNTYMTILVCCAVMLVLCDGKGSLWRDLAAAGVFAFAIFTIETGVLLWVIAIAGFATGFRGVSLRGVGGMTAVLVLFVVVKFALLSGEMPALDERSASFGFRSYGQQELVATFSDRRPLFYGANVVSSIVTVFAAEPRAGLWRFARAIVRGETVPAAMLLNVITSLASSLLLFWFVRARWTAWRRLAFERDDRIVLVFFAVVIANGCVSFPYTKDAIVSPAGLLFALALYPALRAALQRLDDEAPRRRAGVALACLLGLLSLGWTLRAAAVPAGLLYVANGYQLEWVHVDAWLVDQGLPPYSSGQRQVIARVGQEALAIDVPNWRLVGGWMRWAERLFDRP
jgi:hypothetical protein